MQDGAGHSRESQEQTLHPTGASGLGSLCHVCRPGWPGEGLRAWPPVHEGEGAGPGAGIGGRSDTGDGPGSPDACPRRPEPPALRRRPARPPGTRPRTVAAAPLRAGHRQARAHLAPSERLCRSCTRGLGSGSGCPARGSGSARTRTTRAARVPRQDGLRAAPLPRRRHAPPRPSAGLRRAAAHPPRTGPSAGRPASFGPTSRQGRDQSFPRCRGCPLRGTGHQ